MDRRTNADNLPSGPFFTPQDAGHRETRREPRQQNTSSSSELSSLKEEMNKSKLARQMAEQKYGICRGELDACKAQLQTATTQIQIHVQTCQDLQQELKCTKESLKDEVRSLQGKLEEIKDRFTRKLDATRVLLQGAHVLPYTDLLDTVEHFNDEISNIASFLTKNIAYRCSDAFQQELDRARQNAKEMIGSHFCDLLVSQSQNADLGIASPNAPIVQAVVQTFVVTFCVSEISPRSAFTDAQCTKDDTSFSTRDYHQLQPSLPPSTIGNFTSTFLTSLSNIFKIAAWSLPSVKTRAAFELLLVPLFQSKEKLRVAIGEAFSPANIELSLVNYGASFTRQFMEDADVHEGGSAGSGGVVATVGVGLKKAIEGDGRDQLLINVIPALVLLESTLDSALNASQINQQTGKVPLPTVTPSTAPYQDDGRDTK